MKLWGVVMTTRFLPVHPSYIKSLLLLLCLLVINPSCTWLNPYLYFQGDSGDKTTLPIAVEELIEFAGYCDEAYQRANDENKAIKISIQFLSNEVRSDALEIKVFKKNCEINKNCKIINSEGKLNSELKLAILKRAAVLEKTKDQKGKKDYKTVKTSGDK